MPGHQRSPPAVSLLQLAGLGNPHRNHTGEVPTGIGLRGRDCCRHISSKSYLEGLGPTRSPCASRGVPATLPLPRRSEAREGKDRREDRPQPASQENPRSSPDAVQIPETPSPGALREGRGLRIQTARWPPRRRVRDLAEKQNRQGKARPGLRGETGKPRPPILGWGIGNPSRNPRLGARSQPLAKERHSRVEY